MAFANAAGVSSERRRLSCPTSHCRPRTVLVRQPSGPICSAVTQSTLPAAMQPATRRLEIVPPESWADHRFGWLRALAALATPPPSPWCTFRIAELLISPCIGFESNHGNPLGHVLDLLLLLCDSATETSWDPVLLNCRLGMEVSSCVALAVCGCQDGTVTEEPMSDIHDCGVRRHP